MSDSVKVERCRQVVARCEGPEGHGTDHFTNYLEGVWTYSLPLIDPERLIAFLEGVKRSTDTLTRESSDDAIFDIGVAAAQDGIRRYILRESNGSGSGQ